MVGRPLFPRASSPVMLNLFQHPTGQVADFAINSFLAQASACDDMLVGSKVTSGRMRQIQ